MKWLIAAVVTIATSVGMGEVTWQEVDPVDGIAKYAENADGWIAYQVEAKPGMRSMCCWSGGIGQSKSTQTACELGDHRRRSFGSSAEFPLTDTLNIFAELDAGKVTDLLVLGEHCEVTGGQVIQWLGKTPAKQSIDWLGRVVTASGAHSADQAIAAIAWHRNEMATEWLEQHAKQARSERAHQTIFWLGNERGEPGLQSIERLLEALPNGETRRQLTFAIAQNDQARAVELLVDIGHHDNDRQQREQAWFWLAQEFPRRAATELPKRLREVAHANEAEQLVFAISQLPDSMATDGLLRVAKSDLPMSIRRKALFWLAQSDDDRAIDELTSLLQ